MQRDSMSNKPGEMAGIGGDVSDIKAYNLKITGYIGRIRGSIERRVRSQGSSY